MTWIDGGYFFFGSPGRYSSAASEGLLEADEVFARMQRVERLVSALSCFLGVVRGLDGQTDAALGLVDLDDAGVDFLADLERRP